MASNTATSRSRWNRLGSAIGVLALLFAGGYAFCYGTLNVSLWSRAIVWGDSDVWDYLKFPSRGIAGASQPAVYEKGPGYPDGLPKTIALPGGYTSLETLATATDATALLVIKDDRLIYEHYFNGSGPDATQTSFSMAKSYDSAMVGVALHEGALKSIDDPITDYLPELLARDRRFAEIHIRHLISMSSGIHYVEQGLPWADDARTYYAPNLRAAALTHTWIEEPPGKRFLYNNYNPLLMGMILERATGRTVANYLSEKIWQPIGAGPATWSLDAEQRGFEKMESGINARAVDFARLGTLYLHHGKIGDRQVVPPEWVDQSTAFDGRLNEHRGYGFWWWTWRDPELGDYYAASGKGGQYVVVFPKKNLVVVRQGISEGDIRGPEIARAIALAL